MNDEIDNEVAKLLRVDGCTEKETIKVLAICSKNLNTKNYVNQLTTVVLLIFVFLVSYESYVLKKKKKQKNT